MSHLQALPLLVLFLMASLSEASILEGTCKSLGPTGHIKITYADCMKFFQADRGSATADKRGLAVIAAKIIRASAKSTGKRIDALISSKTDRQVQECLHDCAELYSDAVFHLDEAEKGIGSGKPDEMQTALIILSAVLDAPGTCEDGFGMMGVKSPLAAEDSEFTKQATIAIVLTNTL